MTKVVEAYCRKEPVAMPKSKLIALTTILNGVGRLLSKNQITMDEITDALTHVTNGEMMIYDGSWKGLSPAIDGNPLEESSGFNKRQDILTDFFNSKYWDHEDQDNQLKGALGRPRVYDYMVSKEDGGEITTRLVSFFDPHSPNVDFAVGEMKLPPKILNVTTNESIHSSTSGCVQINGSTFDRLRRAIESFPGRYPDYRTKPPKLDDDVRPWLKETGLTESDAERRVFGAIIREHFQLWPDTLKT